MKGRLLALLVGVLLLAGSSIFCAMPNQRDERALLLEEGGVGAVCVNDYRQSENSL